MVPILSVNDTSQNITITKNNPPSGPAASHKLSSGAIAGIAIAIIILCVLVLGAIFFVVRRRRRDRERLDTGAHDPDTKLELEGMNKPVVGELYSPHGEADSREAFKSDLEMEGSKPISILDAKNRRLAEVAGTTGGAEMEASRGGVEMETGHPAAVELDAGPFSRHELASSDAADSGLPSPSIRDPSRLPSPDSRSKSLPSPTGGNKSLPLAGVMKDTLLATPETRPEQPPSPHIEGEQQRPSPGSSQPEPLQSSETTSGDQPLSSSGEREAQTFMRRMRWSSRRRRANG